MRTHILKSIAGFGVIGVVCWNNLIHTRAVVRFPERAADTAVSFEEIWAPIHQQLAFAGYSIGSVGYITARSLRGEPEEGDDVARRLALFYAAIPLNPVRGKIDAPFVIGDFGVEKPTQLPPGLTLLLDPGNGLVLFKGSTKQ